MSRACETLMKKQHAGPQSACHEIPALGRCAYLFLYTPLKNDGKSTQTSLVGLCVCVCVRVRVRAGVEPECFSRGAERKG